MNRENFFDRIEINPQILSGKPLTVFGDGEQMRAFSYIDDVAPVIARSVQNPEAYGQVFNIGGDQPYTVNELARTVAQVMGVTPEIKYLKARNEVVHAVANHNKVREYFDVPAPIDLRTGLTKMADWVRTVGARRTKDFDAIEIPHGLPDGW